MAFTALLQSSSSATVIFQAFAVEGIISYHTAVYLCIGAAIGSVTPNILASLAPSKALDQAHKEISRMGFIALDNLRMAILSFFEPSQEKEMIVLEREETVNYLEHAINIAVSLKRS